MPYATTSAKLRSAWPFELHYLEKVFRAEFLKKHFRPGLHGGRGGAKMHPYPNLKPKFM